MWTICRLPGFDTYWAFTFDPCCTHGDIIPTGTARVESKGPTKPQMDLSYLVVKHSILLGPSSGYRCQISTRQFGMLVSTGLGRFRRELSTFDYVHTFMCIKVRPIPGIHAFNDYPDRREQRRTSQSVYFDFWLSTTIVINFFIYKNPYVCQPAQTLPLNWGLS